MAGETGISWCDATVNFVLGCTPVGPGCERCYAKKFVEQKWLNIKFEPGGRRHVTQSGFTDPPKWQRMHDRRQKTMRVNHNDVPVPVWIFACSLSDFFDNEWPDGVRTRAWAVIRACPSLRWIIVTKRISNVSKMLPPDWNGGRNYPHVGIVGTMVNQDEVDRDGERLRRLKTEFGVRWIGVSIEPQLGDIEVDELGGTLTVRLPKNPTPPTQPLSEDSTLGESVTALGGSFVPNSDGVDWIITGGESKQDERGARPYDLAWADSIVDFGRVANIPVFVKQMGDSPMQNGLPIKFKGKGDDVRTFPAHLQVQQMPRIYDGEVAPLLNPPEQRSLL